MSVLQFFKVALWEIHPKFNLPQGSDPYQDCHEKSQFDVLGGWLDFEKLFWRFYRGKFTVNLNMKRELWK